MDPLTLGIGAIGLGLKLFGGSQASGDASQIASYSAQNAVLEGQVNNQKQIAMNLSAHRQVLEDFRNTQRARAQGLNAAVNQGAQFGSGLAGGQATTTNQGLFNAQGVNQNLQVGNSIFGYDAQESNNNVQIANLKGQQSTAEGLSNLGGSLFSAAGTIGKMGQSVTGGSNNLGSFFMGGGSPSGYGSGR